MHLLWDALNRRKQITSNDDKDTALARVMNLFDLVALGVGSTLGVGVYVLAGAVAFNHAGPAVIISFIIAAITSSVAAICYAELAGRIPKAGSAYVYTYVSIGEFLAFSIGWNLVLEYIIGAACIARGLSAYIDELTDNRMSHLFQKLLPIHINFMTKQLDFFAFAIIILASILLSAGVNKSSTMNNIFTTINLTTIIIIIASGVFKVNLANWTIQKDDIPHGVRGGEGGFMPYGVAGVAAGAAKCFSCFVGFDSLAATGEEAKNPKRNIPLAIVYSFCIVCMAYFSIAIILTMMWPYYELNPDAPFPCIYTKFGWTEIKWIVTIGAIFALISSLLGTLYPLPRILYAISSDGLLFGVFKRVNKCTQTPIHATMLSCFLAATLAMLFDLQQLIGMQSIGTLMAYTIVAVSILLLRYRTGDEDSSNGNGNSSPPSTTIAEILQQIFNLNCLKRPSPLSSGIIRTAILLFALFTMIFCSLLRTDWDHFSSAHTILIVVGLCLLLFLLVIASQPKNDCHDLSMKVPAVPLLPLISIFLNLYLMFNLDTSTWIRFAIWIMIGYVIYFAYGLRYSVEKQRRKMQMALNSRQKSICINAVQHKK